MDIQVELSASAETSRFRFRAMSEDLPVELDSTSSDLLLLRMTLPPLQRVVVTVSRDTSQGVPTTAGGNENHFSRIRVVANGREVARLAAPLSPQQRGLSGLLERGIGGSGQRKARGALLRGEHAVTVDVASEAPGVFWSQVHNFSSRPAIFAVELPGGPVVEERVEPWSHGTLSIQVPAGTQQIVLRGRGRPDGLYLWGAPRLGREGDRRPWVILLSLDTTRRDALGAWGGTAGDTPNLDRLASESTVFDAAWATSPWTLPAHASMFTGLYPSSHRAATTEDVLPPDVVTLAGLLSDAGWLAAGFAGGEMSASHWGIARGFDLYLDPDGFETRGDVLTDAAIRLVEEHVGGPMFLFLNYFDPHALYDAPAPFRERFNVAALAAEIEEGTTWAELAAGSGAAWRSVIAGEAPAGPAELAWLQAAYRAEVAFMDHEIGRLLSVLEDRGVLNEAVLIAVADHGEFLGENGFFSHACRLDTELTWVPLMIRAPGMPADHRDRLLASHVDLMATVLELVGLPAPPGEGLSLAPPGLTAREFRDEVFSEEHEYRTHPLFENMMIAKHLHGFQEGGRRAVVWDSGASCEALDGEEWIETACREGLPDRFAEREEVRLAGASAPLSSSDAGLSEDDRRRLEALGYIR